MLRVFVLITILLMSGCAVTPSSRAQRVLPAYPEMVAKCAFLGGVTARSSFLALNTQIAKFNAQEQAAQLGATHVVWDETQYDPYAVVTGRAYYCDPKKIPAVSQEYFEDYMRMYAYPYDESR